MNFSLKGASSTMSFAPLTSDDIAALDSDREFATAVLDARFPGSHLIGTASDVEVLQLIIDGGPYTDSAEDELIALGTSFGDLLLLELDLEWMRYSDEHGTDIGLRFRDTSIVIFPRDMLIKRVEAEEEIDLQHLYDGVVREVNRLVASGEYQKDRLARHREPLGFIPAVSWSPVNNGCTPCRGRALTGVAHLVNGRTGNLECRMAGVPRPRGSAGHARFAAGRQIRRCCLSGKDCLQWSDERLDAIRGSMVGRPAGAVVHVDCRGDSNDDQSWGGDRAGRIVRAEARADRVDAARAVLCFDIFQRFGNVGKKRIRQKNLRQKMAIWQAMPIFFCRIFFAFSFF
jgi:hypothetical protein